MDVKGTESRNTRAEGIRTPIYLVLLAMALHTCGISVAMIAEDSTALRETDKAGAE